MLSCMGKESGVLCLWTQTSVGQTGFDVRHHRRKNNKIRNRPLPLFARFPFISQLSVNSSLYFSFLLSSSPPLSCYPTPASPLVLPHRPIIQLTHHPPCSHRPFFTLNSLLHRHVHCLPSIYLALSQTDGLLVTQHIYPCKREYVRSALHMLGLNSTFSLSRESH